jgi:hypothetical protein
VSKTRLCTWARGRVHNTSSHLGPGAVSTISLYTWARNRVHNTSSHLCPKPRPHYAFALRNRARSTH